MTDPEFPSQATGNDSGKWRHPAWLLKLARCIEQNPCISALGVAFLPLLMGWALLRATVVGGGGAELSLLDPAFAREDALRRSRPPPSAADIERRAQLQALFDGLESKTREEKLTDAIEAFGRFNQAEGANA
mmetsp:Transcript_37266/g.92764  ORF Transcript_37266/g.92764 Transcript_37266/m.92764 type:complete len:132 (+) Transcript_37266:82-477(+)